MLLLAGNCIGAGMLALPILTGMAGFLPGVLIFSLCWFFMMYTGMLLLEVNVYYGDRVSIISMAERTLGFWGKLSAWFIYLFLFSSLLVAYVSFGGEFFAVIASRLGFEGPVWLWSIIFVLLFGIFVVAGTAFVDYLNRVLMAGLILSYFLFVFIGTGEVDLVNLAYKQWRFMPWIIPVALTSFGYHNVIPSLSFYLDNDIKKLRRVVFWGSLLPLVMYVIWGALVLGIIPVDVILGSMQQGSSPAEVLSGIQNSWMVSIGLQSLMFFAIATSFLGCSLGFVDFLADGFKVNGNKILTRLWISCLVMGIPYMFSLVYPGIFLTALNYAGGFGAVSLFGILPGLMVWSLKDKLRKSFFVKRWVLIIVILFSANIFVLEGLQEAGVSPIKSELESINIIEDLKIDEIE